MSRRLKTIAKYINENLSEYEARVVDGFCDTDRKLSGTRLRTQGKGRNGNRLQVRRKSDKQLVKDHNAAETYRSNSEVEEWLDRVEGGHVPKDLNSRVWF